MLGYDVGVKVGVALVCIALGGCSELLPDVGRLRDQSAAQLADASVEGGSRPPLVPADASTSGDAGVDTAPQTVTVTVAPNGRHAFEPSTVTIRPGDTVRWVWDGDEHTVTSGSNGTGDGLFCSPSGPPCAGQGSLNRGAIYEHTFTAAGTYPYFCRIHRDGGMAGTVTVTAP